MSWLTLATDDYHRLPPTTDDYRGLPATTTDYRRLPTATTGYHRLPPTTTGCHRPELGKLAEDQDTQTPKKFLRTVSPQLKWCENPEIFSSDRVFTAEMV